LNADYIDLIDRMKHGLPKQPFRFWTCKQAICKQWWATVTFKVTTNNVTTTISSEKRAKLPLQQLQK